MKETKEREIKFRAWNKQAQEIAEISAIDFRNGSEMFMKIIICLKKLQIRG